MKGVMIRPARPADRGAVEALLTAEGLTLAGLEGAFGDFFVATHAGEVIAAAGLEIRGSDALVRSVVVGPAWRGEGIGERLTARLLNEARARHLQSLWLLTATAEGFFHRMGFRPVPREAAPAALQATDQLARICSDSAVTMARRVAPLGVLVLCTANAARSQIAEALLRHRGGDLIRAASAGAVPGAGPHPLAIANLAERGIDWSGKRSKGIDEVLDRSWDLVITVCDPARDACPVLPGTAMAHWDLADPAAVTGDAASRRAAFAETAAALERRIDLLLALPFVLFTPESLARAAGELHLAAR